MKLSHFLRTGTIALSLISLCADGADAQKADKKSAKPAAGAPAMTKEMDAAMQAMAKAGELNDNHKRLQKRLGTWTTASKMWMQPGAPPHEATGTAEITSVLAEHFVAEDFKGTLMGKPFTGHGLTGYDNLKQKYVGTWADSMGTSLFYSEGTLDPTGKVLTMTGTNIDPMSGKPTQLKFVTRFESDKKEVMEMYEPGKDGKEFKSMEIVYTKKN